MRLSQNYRNERVYVALDCLIISSSAKSPLMLVCRDIFTLCKFSFWVWQVLV
ncbi:hypothetical protein [Helicobacter pullorum]|uniref:hypothetical protein n=1 Tax=Helicobacter pullorum TaxID=35818 RepID=UPI0018C2FF1C|nr:hypothetical protein [Helicobacter pullorum]